MSRSGWLVVLGPFVAALFVAGFARYMLVDWPTIATDPAFFQHTGWYVLNGGVPYTDVWDVNPPVPFGIAAVLSLLSGGDMLVLHGLSSAFTTLVAAASVLLVGWVASLVTEENAAAVAAGLTMLVVPELFLLSPEGVRAQFYALFFGVLALALALRDRPFLAGAIAALSAGSWQSGGVFALLVVGMAYQRSGRRDALWTIAGGGVVTAVVVLVFAAAGALVPMFVETVVATLSAGSSYTLSERVYSLLLVFGYGSLLLPVALYGWAHAAIRDRWERWWIPVGGVLLALQVLFVDLDGSTDALLWLAFVALGVAVDVERVTTVPDRVGDIARVVNEYR
ncbi:DolP-mannose mannosyltransferase, partial [Natrinema soli]